jgi:hypothetical protein
MDRLRIIIKNYFKNRLQNSLDELKKWKYDVIKLELKKNEIFRQYFQNQSNTIIQDIKNIILNDSSIINKNELNQYIEQEFHNQEKLRSRFDLEIRLFLNNC